MPLKPDCAARKVAAPHHGILPMRMSPQLLLAIPLAATSLASTAASPVAGTPVRTPMQLEAHLHAAGYRNVFDIDLDDGLWEAKVRKDAALWREVAVDPQTGRIYDGAGTRSVDALNTVSDVVADSGYTMMELAEPDGPLWDIDAMGRAGTLREPAGRCSLAFHREAPARRLLIGARERATSHGVARAIT